MVKIQTTWVDKKTGKENTLKIPKIKLGNNLGEDEEIILDLKSTVYRKDFEFKNKKGDMQKGSMFSIKCEMAGQELYAEISYGIAAELDTYADYIGHQFKFQRTLVDGKTKMVVTPMAECPKGENANKVTGQSKQNTNAVEELTMEKLEEELAKFFNSEQLAQWNALYNGPLDKGGCPVDRKSKEHFFSTVAKRWIPHIHEKVMKAYTSTEEVQQ